MKIIQSLNSDRSFTLDKNSRFITEETMFHNQLIDIGSTAELLGGFLAFEGSLEKDGCNDREMTKMRKALFSDTFFITHSIQGKEVMHESEVISLDRDHNNLSQNRIYQLTA